MRDLMNSIQPKRAISPAAATTDNTAFVSQIIDVQGYDSLTFVINTGVESDADATFTVLVEDGAIANLSDAAAVPDNNLLGLEATASFLFSDDNKVFKIGYAGNQRYVRLTVTPAANTGNVFLSAIALLGHPSLGPTPNPPT